MKCSSCGAIISTKIITCDFCGTAVKQTIEETVIEIPEEELFESEQANCNSIAMFECMDTLGDFFRYFDSLAYDPSEESRYYLTAQLTNELYAVIIDTLPDWAGSDMFGILVEEPDNIYKNADGLIVTFDGDATVVFTNGLASIVVVDNHISLTGYGSWDSYDDKGACFWIDADNLAINFGNTSLSNYFFGARWVLIDSDDDHSQILVDANAWVDRIRSISSGFITPDSLVNSEYINQKKLADGSRWTGDLDTKWLMTGYGTHKLVNGDIYEGFCHAGFRHGEGQYTWRNGSVYEGNWANGHQHGYGLHTNPDGTTLEGTWINGSFNG
jgi:hypothetical protein